MSRQEGALGCDVIVHCFECANESVVLGCHVAILQCVDNCDGVVVAPSSQEIETYPLESVCQTLQPLQLKNSSTTFTNTLFGPDG